MSENPVPETASETAADTPESVTPPAAPSEPPPSYVKLAMRNMVRKGRQSLVHFTLTVIALMGLLVGLSYLTR